MLKALSEINLADLENPKAVLSGGIVVDLGSGHYRRKVQELTGVLAELKRLGKHPKAVDLRFARQAVVRCSEPTSNIEKTEKEV
jgi:cell division septal protein FtsQ